MSDTSEYQRGFDAASELVCAAALDRDVRRAALELAAKTCEARRDHRSFHTDEDAEAEACAAAIRALIDQPPPEAG